MSTSPPERLTFPCDYPIKVMVRAEEGVRGQVDAIVERHAAPLDRSGVVERPSAQKNFLGITYVIRATSAEQIAALFADLKQCPHVIRGLSERGWLAERFPSIRWPPRRPGSSPVQHRAGSQVEQPQQ